MVDGPTRPELALTIATVNTRALSLVTPLSAVQGGVRGSKIKKRKEKKEQGKGTLYPMADDVDCLERHVWEEVVALCCVFVYEYSTSIRLFFSLFCMRDDVPRGGI